MRIAVVGSGISGLVAANKLSRDHQLTVFEADSRLGGHTATVDVQLDGRTYAIDTGFIVYNDRTYPQFISLLSELGVDTQPTSMGFSVSCERTGLEYSGANLNTLFAQRRNLLSPYFLGLVRDILRFNKQALKDYQNDRLDADQTLGQYLHQHAFGDGFIQHYLAPMASAIWSSSLQAVLDLPVLFFVRFFKNHGLLQLKDRPQWRTLVGGSRQYIEPLIQPFKGGIRLGCAVEKIERGIQGVRVSTAQYGVESFDEVVIACHSDQALGLLSDAGKAEREVLGAIPYVNNSVVLHTDESVLPRCRKTWSSWNYRLAQTEQPLPVLTYNMNILQNLQSSHTFCVTLNHDEAIDPAKILGRYTYAHPEFSRRGIEAQQRWAEINGSRHTWYCGAYWRNGFHEDGVVSALKVANALRQAG